MGRSLGMPLIMLSCLSGFDICYLNLMDCLVERTNIVFGNWKCHPHKRKLKTNYSNGIQMCHVIGYELYFPFDTTNELLPDLSMCINIFFFFFFFFHRLPRQFLLPLGFKQTRLVAESGDHPH